MMLRTLDLTALRAVIAVADCGSVTRAASLLNLTQSAVSMQIKRLEDSLGQPLFDRAQRRMALSAAGERLSVIGRKMLHLNDEALTELGLIAGQEELTLGLPSDLVSPHMPVILRDMAAACPQLQLNLVVDLTRNLLQRFAAGEMDVILTTETAPGPLGEILARRQLVWIGRPEIEAVPDRPLRVALGKNCIFRPVALAALEKAGLPVIEAIDGDSETVIEASVAAGMAVTVRLEGKSVDGCTYLSGAQGFPDLGHSNICLYRREAGSGNAGGSEARNLLVSELRRLYGS